MALIFSFEYKSFYRDELFSANPEFPLLFCISKVIKNKAAEIVQTAQTVANARHLANSQAVKPISLIFIFSDETADGYVGCHRGLCSGRCCASRSRSWTHDDDGQGVLTNTFTFLVLNYRGELKPSCVKSLGSAQELGSSISKYVARKTGSLYLRMCCKMYYVGEVEGR